MNRALARPTAALPLLGLLLALPGSDARAQEGLGWETVKLEVTRARLMEIRGLLQDRVRAGGLQEGDRMRLNLQLSVVERRLEDGDFRAGDQISLRVEGEPLLTDTFTVAPGPSLPLPVVGDVAMAGVLASELEDHLSRSVGAVVRDPLVRARALVQLSVLGEVTRPGFYLVTPDALLTEALMQAGGPTREADIGKLKIERGPGSPWNPESADAFPEAPLEALSVNELGLHTGDRIIVPASGGVSGRDIAQFAILGLSAVVSLSQLFR